MIGDRTNYTVRARWETWGIAAAVFAAIGLMVATTILVGWWHDSVPAQELTSETGAVSVWREPGDSVTLEQVLALDDAAWMKPSQLDTTGSPEEGPGRWYRVVLPASSQSNLAMICFPGGQFWEVRAHWLRNGMWKSQRGGEDLGWGERAALSQRVAFIIDRELGSPTMVYVRLLEDDNPGDVVLYWPDAMQGRLNVELLSYLHLAYFGIWAAVLAYNFLLAVVLKRRAIFSYVLYVAAFGAMIYFGSGYDGVVGGWTVSRARMVGTLALVHVQLWALTWFARDLIGVGPSGRGRQFIRSVDGALGVSAALVGLWAFALIPGMVMYYAVTFTIALVSLALLAFTARRWWRGQQVSGWFLLALAPALLAFTWLFIATFFPMLPDYLQTVPFLVGSSAEFVLMSLVLAFHYRQLEIENAQIKANQAESLQREVRVRTQELREMTAKLAASNRTKDRIFSVLGHDLRSPVATTISFADVLGQDPDFFSPAELAQQAGWLKQTNEKMLQLLEDLLGWARAEGGEQMLQSTDVAVAEIVAAPIDLLTAVARAKDVQIVNQVPDALVVHGDLKTLQAVVRNLLSNAIKFTRPKGTVRVWATEESDRITLAVEDNGLGMPPAVVERLLAGEGGMSSEGTARERGAGFGWVLCLQCVRLNHGELRIDSEIGRGTRVELHLPPAHFVAHPEQVSDVSGVAAN